MNRAKLQACLDTLAQDGLLQVHEQDGTTAYELSSRGQMRADHLLAQQTEAQFFLLNYLIKKRIDDEDDYNDIVEYVMDLAGTLRDKFAINVLRSLIDNDKKVAGFDPSALPEEVVALYDPERTSGPAN